MEDFSKSNNVSMPNIGGLSITQEFSMKSSALTTVDHGKNNVVQTGCTDGNQGALFDLHKVTRLVEILKQCQKLFTRKEFKTLLKHRAVRSSLSDIVDFYNKGRISLEKNAINCITSFLRLIKKKENSGKKNSSNGETTKNKLELKLSVMIADLKMKSTSRDLTPRVGRTPTCNRRKESSSQASTHNITGRKPRRKSSSKSKSRSRSRSPLLRRNLFPWREHSPQSPSTKRKNSYSRYRRSGSWSPISSSRSRSRSRSHSPSRKGYYFDSKESRSRFRDHPFKYYGESSSSKRPPCSRRLKSPAGLIKEKIHPNRRSRLRKSRSPSLAALRREVDKLRIENHNAMKNLRELMTYNRSSSNSTTHDVGVPSNPYASYLPTRNDFLAQHGATVEDQCFSVSETSLQTQSNCPNSYQIGHKGSNQFPGPNMSSYSPPNNEFLPESAEQISLSKQSRIMHASLPSFSPLDLSPVPLHLPFSDILTYPFPSTDTLVTPSISPSPPSLLNEFTLLRTSESSNEPVLNEPSTEQRFSKENENVENIKTRVKCREVERVKDPVEKVNVGNPASILKSLSNEIKKHVNIFSVSKLSFETSTSGNDTVNSSEQMNEIDPSFIEDSKREKVSVGFRFDDKDGNGDTSDTYYDTAERNLNNLKFPLEVTTVEHECLNETDESAVRKFDSKEHHKVDEIQGETANIEKCKTVPSSCEHSVKKSGQNSDDLGIVVKEMFPSLHISGESTMYPNSVVNRKFRGKGRQICISPIIPKVKGSMNSVFVYKIPPLKCPKVDDNIWKIVQHKPSDQTEQETAGFLSFPDEELNTHEEHDTANIKEVLCVTSPELLATSMLDKMDPSRENVEKQSSELDSNFDTVSFNKNEQHSPRERFHKRSTRNMMQGALSREYAEKRSLNVMHDFGTNPSIKNKQSSPSEQSSENSNRKLIGELYGSGFSNIQIPRGVTLRRCMVTLERESNLSFLTVKRSIMPPNMCKESDAATMNEFLSKGVSKLSTVLDLERKVVPRENEEKPSPKLTATTLDTLASNGSEDCGRLSASNQSQERLNRDMIVEFNGIAFSNVKVPKGVILKKCIISLKRTSIASPSGK